VVAAAAGLAAAGCTLPPPARSPPAADAPALLIERLAEVDRLTELGRIREAIEVAELALIDHYRSEELRDRLTALRSMRQVMFDDDIAAARAHAGAGRPYTALAVLDEIERYGDSDMVAAARTERERIAAAHPAVFRESEGARPVGAGR
jgi:hypothetical protein